MGLNEGFAPHVCDVMEILDEVYNKISASSIKNCWRKTTLVSFDTLANATVDIDIGDEDDEEEEDGITDIEVESMHAMAANFAKNNDCQLKPDENVEVK